MRPIPDLRVYLVTGDDVEDDATASIVSEAVAGGVTLVQLRAKQGDTVARMDAIRRIATVLKPTVVPLIVNDDIEAARSAGVYRVHLGPDDMHPAEARTILGSEAMIGWSIHSLAQLEDRQAIAACDYLAASPVWPTSTKTDTTAPLGLDGVRALRTAMPAHLPLVGIGGISEGNAADVIRAGADGVAVVSAIWSAPDPRAAARRLRQIVDAALNERQV